MAWTESQKSRAKEELLRRRTYKTTATYRKSFFKNASSCVACASVVVLMLSEITKRSGWMDRLSAGYAGCLTLLGFALTLALSYIRYCDWQRYSILERNRSPAEPG
jgi:hypothetical protein